MKYRIEILSLFSILSMTIFSCDDRPIDDKCKVDETFCVAGTTNYLFLCKAGKNITYWDGIKCDGVCDADGKRCITATDLDCSGTDKKIDERTKNCVCIDANMYLNGKNECVCKDHHATKNGAGECVCNDNHAHLNETGKCTCNDPLATMNNAGECECTNENQIMNQLGLCVCKNDFQELNKDSGSCECINSDQEKDNSGMCKCKDSNQELNISTGKCECRENDQELDGNGKCTCKDPNAILNESLKCQCKNGYYLNGNQCVTSTDKNGNHMLDQYETSDIPGIKDKLGTGCQKHTECDSEPDKWDGFCDSFIGYKCSVRCTSDEQCVEEETIDGMKYHFFCRPDGRCAPKEFVTTWNLPNAEFQGNSYNENACLNECVDGNENCYSECIDKKQKIYFYAMCKDIIIDWGDGITEGPRDCLPGKPVIHTYKVANKYNVTIQGNISQFRIYETNMPTTLNKFLGIRAFGPVGIGLKSFAGKQENFTLSKVDIPDPTLMTSMETMFYNAAGFNQPIEKWDVSNVTSMKSMFYKAKSFNQPIGNWDVSNVTTMSNTFEKATSFNQPLAKWNVSNVETTHKMFSNASSFKQDLSDWHLKDGVDCSEMFSSDSGVSSLDKQTCTNTVSICPQVNAESICK